MGMFDYLRCEYPLPDGYTAPEFQTKDFDCEMVTHVITADGRLMMDRGEYVATPKEELPYPDAKPGTWQSICGIMRRVPNMVQSDFHGWLNFYDYNEKDEWHEYNAKFTDGRLVEIVAVPSSPTGATPALQVGTPAQAESPGDEVQKGKP